MISSFGQHDHLTKIHTTLGQHRDYHSVIILDDTELDVHLLMTTEGCVSKGDALSLIYKDLGLTGPTVAAGDEENDRSMFERADYRIVMSKAPDHLKKMATVIAPSSYELGIIPAIDQVLTHVTKNHPSFRS